MSERKWWPTWYVSKLHVVRFAGDYGSRSVCGIGGLLDPDRLRLDWQKRYLAKNPPRCKRCEKLLAALAATPDTNGSEQ